MKEAGREGVEWGMEVARVKVVRVRGRRAVRNFIVLVPWRWLICLKCWQKLSRGSGCGGGGN